ncbi:MAG: beta-propeller domain-containing protein [Ilumatobacteraceae bacterium]
MHRIRSTTMAAATVSIIALAVAACAPDARDAPDASGVRTTPPPATDRPATDRPSATGPTTPDARSPRSTGGFGTSRLVFFEDCPELLDHLRRQASTHVTAWGIDGGPSFPLLYAEAGAMGATDTTDGAAAPAAAADRNSSMLESGGSGTSYSATNTQEAGVDEGDVVETDGTHLFVAGPDGVRIVDVERAGVVESLVVPEGSHQLLLDGVRLLVVTQPYSGAQDTVASLFDVTDVDAPVLVRRTHLEGRITATRAVDGIARLVLTSSLADRLPFVRPDTFGLDEDLALAANREVVTSSPIGEWLPRSFDEAADGSFGPMRAALDCSTVAAPVEDAGLGISWIASIDMRGDGAATGAAGVVSNGETVYASADHLYIATQPWNWMRYDGATPTPPPTIIHQFALSDDGGATYVASGKVEGRLVNQFAMSELDGDLRVAVTVDDWTGGSPSVSSVHVLRPDGTDLAEIGAIGGLGKTEQIYAVRFIGTQAYVVTFRQTDPLYVIDLADPTAPVLTGELKIPGYSAYLHPVGDGLLLGVGQRADDNGRVQGTQLSLFDVRDPALPQQLSTLMIGGSSDAEWDHHAFMFWPEDGTIAIPTSPMWGPCPADLRCLADSGARGNSGVVVAQLEGTQLIGRGMITHDHPSSNGCWNPLQRSLVIGDELVTVGAGQAQFSDRATLATRDVARWGSDDQYGCYYYG